MKLSSPMLNLRGHVRLCTHANRPGRQEPDHHRRTFVACPNSLSMNDSRDDVVAARRGASGNIDPGSGVLPSFNTEPGWSREPVLARDFSGEEVVTVFRAMGNVSGGGDIAAGVCHAATARQPRGQIDVPQGLSPDGAGHHRYQRWATSPLWAWGPRCLRKSAWRSGRVALQAYVRDHALATWLSGYLRPRICTSKEIRCITSSAFCAAGARDRRHRQVKIASRAIAEGDSRVLRS